VEVGARIYTPVALALRQLLARVKYGVDLSPGQLQFSRRPSENPETG